MSKYTTFDNDSRRRSIKLCKFLSSRDKSLDDQRFEITKMIPPYSMTSPYSKILEFNEMTKTACENRNFSLFLKQCRVMFVGDANCGKSSLIHRFTSSSFDEDFKPTIGAGYDRKYLDVLGVSYSVGFWDLPGDERLKCISQFYYKDANVIVVLFDLTRPSTLTNAMSWMQEVLAANANSDPIRFLVGTKSDAISKRTLKVLEARANLVAQDLDAEYFSVSSKHGTEVDSLFKRFIALAFENRIQKLIKPPDYHTVKNNLSKLGAFRQDEKKKKKFWSWLSSCM